MSKSTGRTVSVTDATYERLKAHSRKVGVPMRQLVAGLAAELDTLKPAEAALLVERVRKRQTAAASRSTAAATAARARWSGGA